VTATLPLEFADLERFADWCIGSESARYAKRLASPMAELQSFYDAITPRAAEAIAYLDQYPLDDMPQPALHLMHLLFSMITVSFAVECWREPRVPDSGAARIDCLVEPIP
jgi:hypothetical protein